MRNFDEIIKKLQNESDTDKSIKTPYDVYSLICKLSIKNYSTIKISNLDSSDIKIIVDWMCEHLENANDCDATLSIIHRYLPITSKNTELIKELMLKGASFIDDALSLMSYVATLPHERRYQSTFDEIYTKALSLAIKERNELESSL